MIVIHIGMPKAGSTTIQTFLHANEAALRQLGVDYPTVGRRAGKKHANISHQLSGRNDRFTASLGGVVELGDYLRDSGYATTILSAETFAGMSAEAVRRLADVVSIAGQAIRVVMMTRDLVDLLPSRYAQAVRRGASTDDFDAFFEETMNARRFDFVKLASTWGEAFGWAALRVRPLDARLLVNGDLIDDFLAAAGLDPGLPALRAMPRQARVNESPGWKTLEAIRALFQSPTHASAPEALAARVRSDATRLPRKRIGVAAERVGARMGWNGDKGRYLTAPQARRAFEANVAAVRELNRRLAAPVPAPADLAARGFVERSFLPEASRIPADDLAAFYTAVHAQACELEESRAVDKKAAKTAKRRAAKQLAAGGVAIAG